VYCGKYGVVPFGGHRNAGCQKLAVARLDVFYGRRMAVVRGDAAVGRDGKANVLGAMRS